MCRHLILLLDADEILREMRIHALDRREIYVDPIELEHPDARLAHESADLPEHLHAKLRDTTRFFCKRDKLRGRDIAQLLIINTRQRLRANDLLRMRIDDRLEKDTDIVFGNRPFERAFDSPLMAQTIEILTINANGHLTRHHRLILLAMRNLQRVENIIH